MARLEQIIVGGKLRGLSGTTIVEVVRVEWIGSDAVNVVYRGPEGPSEVLLYREAEQRLELVQANRTFSFDGDGEAFRIGSEAQRIRLAHLFDPYLAVHSSRIEPLPHQITAVYGEMLPRQPLRFLLADDPGAGKTIMAGLLIKELIIRGDLERCLIIAPGSLVEQWQDELKEKFDLSFDLVSREQIEASVTGNPFVERGRLIMRLDMASRSESLQAKLNAAPEWDLVICDEAHRMAASLFGNEVKYTKRHKLGQLVGQRARNFLLMSATPHNGSDADFQLFMGLLDADRFEGRQREGARKVDVSDIMRRLTKEELRKFDGSPLFPERKAYTIEYKLSDLEAQLYAAVTSYVRTEMRNLNALAGDDKRRNNVGFALQILQRRLASSPAAIFHSLRRRRERLEARLAEEQIIARGGRLQRQEQFPSAIDDDEDSDLDEAGGAEQEHAEQEIADRATAAQTIPELEAELVVLRDLEKLADNLRKSGQDAKWRQLGEIIDKPPMVDEATGQRRKLLIFTEPRDTLEYLASHIRQRIGKHDAVAVIHGGVPRDVRKANIAAFNDDPEVRVLIANDAAGEGVNLQRGAHLMVNYDLPWNPNRLEQRFGRIHRIGQTEVCHLWNLVASETREGEVYARLLDKLEHAREALGGRDSVYDVLGELFQGKPLRELLMEAVLYGDDPKRRQILFTAVDGVVDTGKIETLIRERKLTSEGLDPRSVIEIREKMERAQARRLQPHYIRAFFEKAFTRLGGQLRRREAGRYEITRVPGRIRERDRVSGNVTPVAERYERVCFDKANIPGKPQAALITPGHGLLDATIAVTLDEAADVLKQGTILIDEADEHGLDPRVLVTLDHAVRDGRPGRNGQPNVVSRKMQFVMIDEQGTTQDAGPAPYLDYRPLKAEETQIARALLNAEWLKGDIERLAMRFAIEHLAQEHLKVTRERRLAEIDRVEGEVKARLKREVNYWDGRAEELMLKEQAGKGGRLNSGNARATAQNLSDRLDKRLRQLNEERDIQALPPQVKGAALIVPIGLLRPKTGSAPLGFAEDAVARQEIERLAMQAVFAAERALGREPRDVSAAKVGYDIESLDPKTGHLHFLEVKGRIEGGDTITVTTNEMIVALNSEDRFVLAIVPVSAGGFAHQPVYVRRPFDSAPAQDACATIFHLDRLVARGTEPC
jgi:superfamily II DNA or RNA helicase